MGKTEKLKAIVPRELEIIKETKKNGRRVFWHPAGSKVKTCEEDFHSVISIMLENFKGLADLMNDNDWARYGYILEAMYRDAERRLDEIMTFVNRAVGEIYCVSITKGSACYRTGRIVDASIESYGDEAKEAQDG